MTREHAGEALSWIWTWEKTTAQVTAAIAQV